MVYSVEDAGNDTGNVTGKRVGIYKREPMARSRKSTTIQDVAELDFVRDNMVLTDLPPAGERPARRVALFPAPMKTEFLSKNDNALACAPRLGEHNEAILGEAGLTPEEIERLREDDVI